MTILRVLSPTIARAIFLLLVGSSISVAQQLQVPWINGAELGKGYDIDTGELKDSQCVQKEDLPARELGGGGRDDLLLFNEVTASTNFALHCQSALAQQPSLQP